MIKVVERDLPTTIAQNNLLKLKKHSALKYLGICDI